MNMDKKKTNVKKKEVCETFNIKENGKEKVVESCGIEEEKISTEGQRKKQNKLFGKIILVMVCFLAFFFLILFVNYSMNHFKVEGVTFETDTISIIGTTLYRTSIPVIYNGEKASYNFYLRNDPRELRNKVQMNEEIIFRKNLVLNLTTEDLFCEGDWTIGLANVQNLYSILEINLLVKNNQSYEPKEEFMFITINKGNKTEIIQIDEYNYEINVNGCEVLPAFERLMLETFIRYKQLNN